MRVCLRPHAKYIFRENVKVMHPSLFTSNTRNASEASTVIRWFNKTTLFSIVVFVTVFQASQTSSLILRCNSVNVMALLDIGK